MAVRLITADAVTLSRLGYRTAVQGSADLTLAGQADTVAEAITLTAECRPDVVVIDVALPDGDGAHGEHGFELARTLRAEHPQLGLLLTGPDNHDLVLDSLAAGLSGYLSRSAPVEVLISAIRHAAVAPTSFTSPDLAAALIKRRHRHVLSPREQEVLQYLHKGESLTAIARRLRVTESTVRTYVARVYSKLDVHSRAEAIRTQGTT
ncbi:MAG TPA: response regulator transcription factor [Candidatus Limnocylindrales bacterium]|nr:response regulator transcription factor [Candidatus Limnocylindrales bacterium]